MALETRFGRFVRVDDGPGTAAGCNVHAAGAVTGFTPDILGILARRLQMIMGRADETVRDFIMALRARLGADISGSGNLRGRQLHTIDVGAGNHAKADQCGQQREQYPRQATILPGHGLAEYTAQDRFHKFNDRKACGVFFPGWHFQNV